MSRTHDVGTIVKHCRYCGAAIEWTFSDGAFATFIAHDDAFCRDTILERVRDLEKLLAANQVAYEHATRNQLRIMDQILLDAGLPSMEQRREEATRESLVASWRSRNFDQES